MLTPSIFASFRYGYTRSNLYEYFDGNVRDANDQKLAPVILANQVSKGYSMFKIGENMPYFGSKVRTSINDTHSLYVTFNQLKGRHALKYGLDMRLVRWNENQAGRIAKTESSTSIPDSRDPIRPRPRQLTPPDRRCLRCCWDCPTMRASATTAPLSLQSLYSALYLQDDIKVSRKLSLNLGLRHELETPQTERFDRISFGVDPDYVLPLSVPGVAPLKGALLFVGQDGRGRRQALTDTNNFGPRFGFAYQLTRTTVLRGGYGLFFSSGLSNIGGTSSVNVNALGAQPSFNAVTRIPSSNSTDGGRTALTTIQNPFPNGLVTPTGNSLGALTELGNSISYANPYRVMPYVQQWSFSVQRMVGRDLMVDAGYVGSHALKQFNTFNWNERNDAWLAQGSGEFDQIPNPFYGVFPATSTLGGSRNTTKGKFWVTFPQFNNVTMYGANTDRALYHSGQFAVRKRMSHGLMLNINYTYSKNMIYDGASLINERHWRSVASTDRPHIFRIFGNYELPFGSKRALFSDAPKWAQCDHRRMGSVRLVPHDQRNADLDYGTPWPADADRQSREEREGERPPGRPDRSGDRRPHKSLFRHHSVAGAVRRLCRQSGAVALLLAARPARHLHERDCVQDVQDPRRDALRVADGGQQCAEPSDLQQSRDRHE